MVEDDYLEGESRANSTDERRQQKLQQKLELMGNLRDIPRIQTTSEPNSFRKRRQDKRDWNETKDAEFLEEEERNNEASRGE